MICVWQENEYKSICGYLKEITNCQGYRYNKAVQSQCMLTCTGEGDDILTTAPYIHKVSIGRCPEGQVCKVRCSGHDGCKSMIFEGTFEKIECGATRSEGHACRGTQFRGNVKNIICDNHSCRGAKFNAVSEITTCGDHSCSTAEFSGNSMSIVCGDHACDDVTVSGKYQQFRGGQYCCGSSHFKDVGEMGATTHMFFGDRTLSGSPTMTFSPGASVHIACTVSTYDRATEARVYRVGEGCERSGLKALLPESLSALTHMNAVKITGFKGPTYPNVLEGIIWPPHECTNQPATSWLCPKLGSCAVLPHDCKKDELPRVPYYHNVDMGHGAHLCLFSGSITVTAPEAGEEIVLSEIASDCSAGQDGYRTAANVNVDGAQQWITSTRPSEFELVVRGSNLKLAARSSPFASKAVKVSLDGVVIGSGEPLPMCRTQSGKSPCQINRNPVDLDQSMGTGLAAESIVGEHNLLVMGNSIQDRSCLLQGVVLFSPIDNVATVMVCCCDPTAEIIFAQAYLDPNYRDPRSSSPLCFPANYSQLSLKLLCLNRSAGRCCRCCSLAASWRTSLRQLHRMWQYNWSHMAGSLLLGMRQAIK